MSTCIEFCGKPKRRNLRPEGKLEDMKPELPTASSAKQEQLKKKDLLNRLRYVEVKIDNQDVSPPPRGIDINIDL